MAITPDEVKKLREKTGAGFKDCKTALEQCGGNFEAAVDELRKKGIAVASKKADKATQQGMIGTYIHAGDQVAVLVEVNCQTDFAARTEAFREFAHEVAMQIAAARPLWVSRDEVPADAIERERAVLVEQAKAEGKPEAIAEKMVEGRIRKFYEERCLLDQKYIRDDSKSINDLLLDLTAKTGELIVVRRFVRMQVGEELG
ncbi:MAG: translation elongation factor Ts [Armatimonadota bacterium]